MPPAPLSFAPAVAQLRDALPGAANEPDAVHRVRAASRRLDTWLRLAGRARLRDDLRWLRQAAGPVRDLDVLLARDWPDRERRRLRALRGRARRALRETLADARVSALTYALAALPSADADEARVRLTALARAARALTPEEDDFVGLHDLRRAIRRVRHALEWFGAPDELAPAQAALGELGDLALAVRLLGADVLSAELLAQRARDALATWRLARPHLTPWC